MADNTTRFEKQDARKPEGYGGSFSIHLNFMAIKKCNKYCAISAGTWYDDHAVHSI